jgi:hypothetical protein
LRKSEGRRRKRKGKRGTILGTEAINEGMNESGDEEDQQMINPNDNLPTPLEDALDFVVDDKN